MFLRNILPFKYRCRYCSKSYINYASKYKHQNSHGPLKHVCNICGKKFQLKKNLTVHDRTHAGVRLYQCPRCPQFYTTKRAMDYHFKVHMDQKFDCNQCSLSTNNQDNLHQHIIGAHGSWWLSPCGIRYSWAPKMFRHHKKCAQCQIIKKKKETVTEKLAKWIGKEMLKNQNSTMLDLVLVHNPISHNVLCFNHILTASYCV